jgi:hypothetical protein
LQPYRRPDAILAFNESASSDFLYETLDHRETEAPHPFRLGGEEGVEGSENRVWLHSDAAIGDPKFDPLAGFQRDRLGAYAI